MTTKDTTKSDTAAATKAATESKGPLEQLREPFPANLISKLPKPSKKQTEEVKADYTKGVRCTECGSWHHPNVVHLDYVGHAAVTHRLLDVDPKWSWEPLAFRDGLPAFDATGGLWIKLTVAGVSRLGYGHAAPKPGQDPGAREKEVIGDALRNAGMRFGMALDLWHKGDLHAVEEDKETAEEVARKEQEKKDRRKDAIAKGTAIAAAIAAMKSKAEAKDWQTAHATELGVIDQDAHDVWERLSQLFADKFAKLPENAATGQDSSGR